MNSLQKFQELLKNIFQFESSDLDFGVYRIFNHKRKEIEDFIQNKLPAIVEEAFRKHKSSITENIDKEFEQVKQEIIKNFGNESITPTGDIKDEFKNTPLGKRYLEIKARKEEAEKIDEIKLQVFNDLYKFFSRYYEEGDFVPQYRYSIKEHKYAIPYNGEEVKLYWANAEQYYIKTGILFQDYAFRVGEYRIVFKTETAEEELSTNKQNEKQKRFILSGRGLEIDDNKKEVVIYFSYKLLSDEEIKNLKEKIKNGNGNDKNGENGNEEDKKEQIPKQEKINEVIFEEIKGILQNKKQYYLLKELIENTKNEKPILLYHINRFTAKNTRDFFIHKNLKRFLQEQLDYFIKAEVLDIKTLEEERYLDKHITRAKTVREIGEKIIDFLSQIEDFQKRLWEKKKFVIKTDYVITLDRIKEWTDERFLDEVIEVVLRNERQLKEWEELGFGKIEKKEDLIDKKLPIDTRYFDEEFKFKLLEKISERFDLDEILDGILIKSENWQALNLLLNKYKEKVQTIYIDPPYNTGSDEFLYRDRYQHSSWLTMMENRLSLARELMKDDGVIFVSIDDNEVENLIWLVKKNYNLVDIIIIKTGESLRAIGGGESKSLVKKCEFLLFATKIIDKFTPNEEGIFELIDLREFLKEKIAESNSYEYNLILKEEGYKELAFYIETQDGKIPVYRHKDYLIERIDFKDKSFDDIYSIYLDNFDKIFQTAISQSSIFDKVKSKMSDGKLYSLDYIPRSGRFKGQKITRYFYNKREVVFLKNICVKKGDKIFKMDRLSNLWLDINWQGIMNEGKVSYKFGKKAEYMLYKIINYSSKERDVILDFFLGGGTTTAVAHKMKRKWLGVEFNDEMFSIAMKRMKYVLFSDETGISGNISWQGGGFFKYHILEQYEDALDNIELKENKKAQELFEDEYLLKYFLDFETRDSEYLLDIEKLKNPFAYKLKINEGTEPKEVVIDIPETFNYLLGLKVKRIKTRDNEGKKYLFILGEKEGRDFAVVWREFDDNWVEELNEIKEKEDKKEEINYEKFKIYIDKELIKKELKDWKPQVVYINGQSILTQNFDDFQAEIRYIEPEFKRLMEK